MSKVDWSLAPEEAEFYADGCFWRDSDCRWFPTSRAWKSRAWKSDEIGDYSLFPDYEPRPKERPSEQVGAESNDGVSYNAPERTTGDLSAKPVSKYHRTIKGVQVDLYDVLVAYGVTCPALAHALKKMLMPGQRHAKTFEQDIDEAIASLQRAKELAAGPTTN